jgi:hypothetical protein
MASDMGEKSVSHMVISMNKVLLALGFLLTFAAGAFAHQIPVLEVEAEFEANRQSTIRVNVDPRLFLSSDPTSLPPVPASWYLSQTQAEKDKTATQAKDYIDRMITLTIGSEKWRPQWEIIAIDSASNFPLSESSAETHLLARFTGPLPAVAGDFHLSLNEKCSVALILVTSLEGKVSRRPDSVFPGETSHAFALPPLSAAAPSPAPSPPSPTVSTPSPKPPPVIIGSRITFWNIPGVRAFAWSQWILAVLVGLAAIRNWMSAMAGFLGFHLARLATFLAANDGWLPPSPPWMAIAFWVSLAAVTWVVCTAKCTPRGANWLFPLGMVACGFCHALLFPIAGTELGGHVISQELWLAARQIVACLLVMAIAISVCRLLPRRAW